MKYATYVAAGLIALAACATSSADDDPRSGSENGQGDGGPSVVDAGPSVVDGADAAWDAERPLACGATGFCETRLPTSDLGVPLSLRGVWVVDSNDVWSVSAEGFVVHYDGTTWTTVYRASHALHSVWGTASGVWAGGEGGVLLHGSANGPWMRIETRHVTTIRAIYGTGDDDVWFVSRGNSVDHFDGTTLTNHPIHIPRLEITTIFGRAGYGAYAAGYVKAPPTPSGSVGIVAHEPHVLQLTTTKISTFNASLAAQEGFVPMSGAVTDAPSDDQRVFLLGYLDTNLYLRFRSCSFGKDNVVALNTLQIPSLISELMVSGSTAPGADAPSPVPPFPVWAHDWSDILFPYPLLGTVFRWSDSVLTNYSLRMGYDFDPRTVFGVHGNSTDTWMVGDGLALKGPTR